MAHQPSSEPAGHQRAGTADVHPPYLYPDYKATRVRAPEKPLVILPESLSQVTGPAYGHGRVGPLDHDLTRQHGGEPLGERIIVTGRVLDGDGRPVRGSLIEIWQANAAGRYIHSADQHEAPLDPNFFGGGRCTTDEQGRFRFYSVKPGAYPWEGGRVPAARRRELQAPTQGTSPRGR